MEKDAYAEALDKIPHKPSLSDAEKLEREKAAAAAIAHKEEHHTDVVKAEAARKKKIDKARANKEQYRRPPRLGPLFTGYHKPKSHHHGLMGKISSYFKQGQKIDQTSCQNMFKTYQDKQWLLIGLVNAARDEFTDTDIVLKSLPENREELKRGVLRLEGIYNQALPAKQSKVVGHTLTGETMSVLKPIRILNDRHFVDTGDEAHQTAYYKQNQFYKRFLQWDTYPQVINTRKLFTPSPPSEKTDVNWTMQYQEFWLGFTLIGDEYLHWSQAYYLIDLMIYYKYHTTINTITSVPASLAVPLALGSDMPGDFNSSVNVTFGECKLYEGHIERQDSFGEFAEVGLNQVVSFSRTWMETTQETVKSLWVDPNHQGSGGGNHSQGEHTGGGTTGDGAGAGAGISGNGSGSMADTELEDEGNSNDTRLLPHMKLKDGTIIHATDLPKRMLSEHKTLLKTWTRVEKEQKCYIRVDGGGNSPGGSNAGSTSSSTTTGGTQTGPSGGSGHSQGGHADVPEWDYEVFNHPDTEVYDTPTGAANEVCKEVDVKYQYGLFDVDREWTSSSVVKQVQPGRFLVVGTIVVSGNCQLAPIVLEINRRLPSLVKYKLSTRCKAQAVKFHGIMTADKWYKSKHGATLIKIVVVIVVIIITIFSFGTASAPAAGAGAGIIAGITTTMVVDFLIDMAIGFIIGKIIEVIIVALVKKYGDKIGWLVVIAAIIVMAVGAYSGNFSMFEVALDMLNVGFNALSLAFQYEAMDIAEEIQHESDLYAKRTKELERRAKEEGLGEYGHGPLYGMLTTTSNEPYKFLNETPTGFLNRCANGVGALTVASELEIDGFVGSAMILPTMTTV